MAILNSHSAPISGRYQIIKWIGAGGMQNVYAAHDLLFKRDVAIKTPKEGATLKRFEKSAVMSAKVNHINVAKTLDYVEDIGVPFLVEELVNGEDFSKFFPKIIPIMPPSACARIFHQLARGLAASHHAGVVHRDLKPSNIMVVNGARLSSVKITDFGIAKMAEAEIGEWAEVGKGGTTSSKTVLGAIPYMAPESVTNFSEASAPADVWAIAAIVYQLLSGKLPFGEGLLSIPAILKGDTPPVPQAISALQFRELGTELYDIIVKCLNPDPKIRITAENLVLALEPLCYAVDEYEMGSITKVHTSYLGFLRSDDGVDAMYHIESFYGGVSPAVGQRVWFARHPGEGNDRAFPLVRLAG
ncbi:serine/threonine-protein kinase [Sphingopyxis sp. LARHCG72]